MLRADRVSWRTEGTREQRNKVFDFNTPSFPDEDAAHMVLGRKLW
jgi:hypothetical protein